MESSEPRPELTIDGVSWALHRPGSFRRWTGLGALVSSIAGSLSLGTNSARLLPGTFSHPHPASGPGGWLLAIGFFCLLAYVLSLTIQPGPVATTAGGTLRLSGRRLAVAGDEDVALSDIEAGWEADSGPAVVDLHGGRPGVTAVAAGPERKGCRAVFRLRDGRELVVDTGSPSRTAALLRAAGVDQRVARLPVGSALSAFPLGKVLGGAAVFLLAISAIGGAAGLGSALVSASRGLATGVDIANAALSFAMPLLLLAGVLRVLAPRTAVVGMDGVAIEGLFSRGFVPYSEITAATGDERGVTLTRDRGLFRRAYLPRAPGGDGLLTRITAAMKAHGNNTASIQIDRLDRRGRPLEEWLKDLTALTDRSAAGYRASPLLPEQLAAVVEDAAVAPERRIAAAVSIAASGDEEARARVRIAAETSADLELRAALEQAAEGEIPERALLRASRPEP